MRMQRPPAGGGTGTMLDFAASIKGDFIFHGRLPKGDKWHEKVAFEGVSAAMMTKDGKCLRTYKHCGRFQTCERPLHSRPGDWTDYWVDSDYYDPDHDYQQNVNAELKRILSWA